LYNRERVRSFCNSVWTEFDFSPAPQRRSSQAAARLPKVDLTRSRFIFCALQEKVTSKFLQLGLDRVRH